ncbi:hypothetical protein [Nocardia otitidiscaviarum]|uniref:hypothetical protein n=1 Tax=Nocardia otitidiscaviarum TaxID=1823 RepID=UPI00189619C3|nr:hypothetical protein [Nocardia otitidiscaviarum]MBF6180815.1 hypothetical protein [Nocardia otitidiscaviarum]
MLVISVQAILEEATSDARFDGGNVRQLSSLLEAENLARLRRDYSTVCFLAFDPVADRPVADYVQGCTLADDSGPDILVMFTWHQPAPIVVPVSGSVTGGWGEIQRGVNPSYELLRTLFVGGRRVPRPPGLVVFGDFAESTDGVFLPLPQENPDAVRSHLRTVFADIEEMAQHTKPRKFLDALGVHWTQAGLEYERTNARPIREWLLKGFQAARRNGGDIVGVVGGLGVL